MRDFMKLRIYLTAGEYIYLMATVWTAMLLASLTMLIFQDPSQAVKSLIAGSHEAVTLTLNLLALYAFWLGFFNIIEKLGISRFLEKLLRPVINKLFPGASEKARKYITMNMSANLLGLGNAATPMAMLAIGEMDNGSTKASANMIMLTVISATSLQLLPTTVIGLRATHQSIAPADFIFPSLIATVTSTAIGIILVKLISRFERKRAAKKNAASESVKPQNAKEHAPQTAKSQNATENTESAKSQNATAKVKDEKRQAGKGAKKERERTQSYVTTAVPLFSKERGRVNADYKKIAKISDTKHRNAAKMRKRERKFMKQRAKI